MVLVAVGAFIGALACANSAAASSHDHSTLRSTSIVESSSDENTVRPQSAGHGAHRPIGQSPLDAQPTDDVVGHPGLACVVAIDLTCQIVAGVLVAGPPVAVVAPMFAECHHEPDSPVPRCSAVLAS